MREPIGVGGGACAPAPGPHAAPGGPAHARARSYSGVVYAPLIPPSTRNVVALT